MDLVDQYRELRPIEISGMGLGYEKACQQMLEAGLKWLETNPNANLTVKTLKGVYGIATPENDAEELSQTITDEVEGCTGAMHHAVLSHLYHIHTLGLEEWHKKVLEDRG